MRLSSRIAQVIVEAARTRIGPVQDFINGCPAVGFVFHFSNGRETLIEPAAAVQRRINSVESRAAIYRDRLVFFYAQLHANALKQRFREFENARAPVLGRMCRGGTIESLLRAIHGSERAGTLGFAQAIHGGFLESSLVK